MKSYIIHLIRHGLTNANLEGQYVGHTDVPLCTAGIDQLKMIKRKIEYPEVQAVFSSPLARSVESARIIYPNQEPIAIPDLIEYNFGEFEMCTAKELENNDDFSNWIRGGVNTKAPHGESNGEFAHRVCQAFEKIVESLMKTGITNVAIVGHAGVLMTILSAYGIPEAPMNQWMMDAGYGYTIRVTPTVWMQGNKFEVIDTCPFTKEVLAVLAKEEK